MAMEKLKKGAKSAACGIGIATGILVGTTCLVGGAGLVMTIASEMKDYATYGEECVEIRRTRPDPISPFYFEFKACKDDTFKLESGYFCSSHSDVWSGNITPDGFKLEKCNGMTFEQASNEGYYGWSSCESRLNFAVKEFDLDRILEYWRSEQNNQ